MVEAQTEQDIAKELEELKKAEDNNKFRTTQTLPTQSEDQINPSAPAGGKVRAPPKRKGASTNLVGME